MAACPSWSQAGESHTRSCPSFIHHLIPDRKNYAPHVDSSMPVSSLITPKQSKVIYYNVSNTCYCMWTTTSKQRKY